MKSVRGCLVVCASLVLALSACSSGDVGAAPATQSSDESAELSCDDPGVECDDYGNILNEGEASEEDDSGGEVSENDTSSEGLKAEDLPDEIDNCESTYPSRSDGAEHYGTTAVMVVNDSYLPIYGIETDYTVETMEGDVLFTCNENRPEIRNFGMIGSDTPALRIYGDVQGEPFDTTLNVSEQDESLGYGETQYNFMYIYLEPDGSIVLHQDHASSYDPPMVENNA